MTESAGDRLSRLLALVPWLVAHNKVTLQECAEHFGIDVETLERDLWLLVVCGIPGYGPDQLVDIQFWDDDIIDVLDPLTLARPMRLSRQEALTLLVALRLLAQVPGAADADREAIGSAAAKIEGAANAGGLSRVVTVAVPGSTDLAAAVDDALGAGTALEIRYEAATRDEVTDRIIEPERVFTTDGLTYVEAYCHLAGARRTFRLDRIRSAAPASAPERDAAGAVPMPTTDPGPLVAEIALAPQARWVIDVYGGEASVIDGRTVVRLPLLSLDWGVHLVLSLHGQAVALAPRDLVEAVGDAARGALAAYAGSVGKSPE